MRHRDLGPDNRTRWTGGALLLGGSTIVLIVLFLWLVFG